MKCPKCKTQNLGNATECDHCGVVFGDLHGGQPVSEDQNCRCCCGRPGDIKQDGAWKCWESAGYTRIPNPAIVDGTGNSYRERWYRERGLPYEPPKISQVGSFRNLGSFNPNRVQRMREPGCDEEEMENEARTA